MPGLRAIYSTHIATHRACMHHPGRVLEHIQHASEHRRRPADTVLRAGWQMRTLGPSNGVRAVLQSHHRQCGINCRLRSWFTILWPWKNTWKKSCHWRCDPNPSMQIVCARARVDNGSHAFRCGSKALKKQDVHPDPFTIDHITISRCPKTFIVTVDRQFWFLCCVAYTWHSLRVRTLGSMCFVLNFVKAQAKGTHWRALIGSTLLKILSASALACAKNLFLYLF